MDPEKEKRFRFRARYEAEQAAAQEPVEPEPEGLDLQDVRGAGQSALRGLLAGYGDEAVGLARATMDKILPETEADEIARGLDDGRNTQSFGDTYAMHRDDARASQKEFSEENPGTALGLELAGGLASPINKIAPGVGTTGGRVARLAQSVGRGGAEGAIAGFGEGEGTLDEQLANAYKASLTGAGMSGALTGLGGAAGRGLSKRRVQEKLQKADGTFKPLHLAEKSGLIGDAYRGLVGRSYGGMEKLHKQQQPFLQKAIDAVETAGSKVDDQIAGVNNRTARKAVEAAIPSGMSAKKAAQIRGKTPLEAERALSKWYKKNAFKDVTGQESFRWDPQLQGRIRTMLNDNPELKNEVGGAVGSIKSLDSYLNPMNAGGVPGDVLMEIRNTFARKANKPMPSLKGKGNRTIAQEFDTMIEKRLGADSAEFARYKSSLDSWGSKQALSKAARQARKAGVDIDAKNIGSKAPDMGPIQQEARAAREEIVGLKQAAKADKKAARQEMAAFNTLRTPEKATGLSSILTTGLLGTLIGGPVGGVAAIPAGIVASNILAAPSTQKAFAGQTGLQRKLADLLRKGDTAEVTRFIAREVARQKTEQENN